MPRMSKLDHKQVPSTHNSKTTFCVVQPVVPTTMYAFTKTIHTIFVLSNKIPSAFLSLDRKKMNEIII